MSITFAGPLTDTQARRPWRALACALFGHAVDNHDLALVPPGEDPRCPCGARYLSRDGSETRVRHTLSCFFGQHRYLRSGVRQGHHEYVCVQCGHPLLFAVERDPYAGRERFGKKVRYLCGLFGHRVHRVAARHGLTEYACFCGHSFLRGAPAATRITHPAVCVALGHFIRFLEHRDGHDEHLCRNCGHTFNFVRPA